VDRALCCDRRSRDHGRPASGLGHLADRNGREAAGEAMSTAGGKGDALVESGANKLDELSRKAAARGGLAGKLADELADDASFLRKLKPSLIVARAKGEAAKDADPGAPVRAPSGPQVGARPTGSSAKNPFAVAGAAFAVGALLAKVIDWRGHAHPRR
jgi:hypothetical protein